MNLKEKFGFGKLANEDELLAHDLTKAARPKSRFDAAISHIITNMLMQLVVPWIKKCFDKYTEQDFHYQMANGFDFIADWKANHGEAEFGQFLAMARRLRYRFDYDSVAIFHEVMNIFNKKGWILEKFEMERLMNVILDLREMIYR